LISLNEALQVLTDSALSPRTEKTPLSRALGRVLTADLYASIEMPPFDKSAMDGYALNSTDNSASYLIKATIPAGVISEVEITPGTCAAIMTGAPLPRGADLVVRREFTRIEAGRMFKTSPESGKNVCKKGEDISPGDLLLKAGTLLRPQEIALAATQGQARLTVYRRPRVAIITTGSELVPLEQALPPGAIHDSNTYSLAAQVEQAGARPRPLGIVADDPEQTVRAIKTAMTGNDLVLLSGGVSAGDFDYVPEALAAAGAQTVFDKVAVQPGMPTLFAWHEKCLFFGLPGNPVSTFVIFHVFVRPLLLRLQNLPPDPPPQPGVMLNSWQRKNSSRTLFLPVDFREGRINTLPYHGSAHLPALTGANALLEIPAGVAALAAGAQAYVRLV